MSETQTLAPRHPSRSRRSLVVWRGYRGGIAPADLDRRASGCLAMAGTHALLEPGVVSAAHEAGVGVALLTQSWRNQLDPEDPRRAGTFALLPYSRPGRQLAPDDRPLAGVHAERYARDHVEAEIAARASLLTTPGHVLEFEAGPGRAGELLLARLCSQEFAARGGAVPPPGAPEVGRRELYATIVVRGAHAVHPLVVDSLVRAYAELEGISGYWIVAANCTKSRIQVQAFATLALRLEAATGRPTVCAGLGHCHLAMLAGGLAASCAGLHGMSFRYPPEALPEPPEDPDEEETGLGVHTYHPAILGNVGKLGAEGEPARLAVFANTPCLCGHHLPGTPPRERREIVAHNSRCEGQDALSLIEPRVDEAQGRLLARAEAAERTRSFIRVGKLARGFYGPSAATAALAEHEGRAGGRNA